MMKMLIVMVVVLALFSVEGGVDSPQEVQILRTVACGDVGGDAFFPFSVFVAFAVVIVVVIVIIISLSFRYYCHPVRSVEMVASGPSAMIICRRRAAAMMCFVGELVEALSQPPRG